MPDPGTSTPPSISLVVLYYDQPDELERLLSDLQAFTDLPDEIVIIDDHSIKSPLANTSIELSGTTVHHLQNPHNLGPVGTMNAGLNRVTGDFVHFLACDDSISADFYSVARRHLTDHPGMGMYSTNSRVIGAAGEDMGTYRLPQPADAATALPANDVRDALYGEGSWFAGHATIFSTTRLREIGGFEDSLEEFADAFACYVLSCKWGSFFEPRPLACKTDPVSGRNMTIYQDRRKSRAIRDAVIARMEDRFSDIFSPAFVRRFVRRWRFNERAIHLYASNETVSGAVSLSALAKARAVVLFVIYRPDEFIERALIRRRRPRLHAD